MGVGQEQAHGLDLSDAVGRHGLGVAGNIRLVHFDADYMPALLLPRPISRHALFAVRPRGIPLCKSKSSLVIMIQTFFRYR